MNKFSIIFVQTLCCILSLSASAADKQVNKRMDRRVGDFDEDQAYAVKPREKSSDIGEAYANINEVSSPQVNYLNPPRYTQPSRELFLNEQQNASSTKPMKGE